MNLYVVFEKHDDKYRIIGVCDSESTADVIASNTIARGLDYGAYSIPYKTNTQFEDSLYVTYVKDPSDITTGGFKVLLTKDEIPTVDDFFIYKTENSAIKKAKDLPGILEVDGKGVYHKIKMNTAYDLYK